MNYRKPLALVMLVLSVGACGSPATSKPSKPTPLATYDNTQTAEKWLVTAEPERALEPAMKTGYWMLSAKPSGRGCEYLVIGDTQLLGDGQIAVSKSYGVQLNKEGSYLYLIGECAKKWSHA